MIANAAVCKGLAAFIYKSNKNGLFKSKIKSSLFSWCYVESCNEWWGPSSPLSAWPMQLRRKTSQLWRAVGDTVSDLTCPGNKLRTCRTDNDVVIHQANGLQFCNSWNQSTAYNILIRLETSGTVIYFAAVLNALTCSCVWIHMGEKIFDVSLYWARLVLTNHNLFSKIME